MNVFEASQGMIPQNIRKYNSIDNFHKKNLLKVNNRNTLLYNKCAQSVNWRQIVSIDVALLSWLLTLTIE